MPDTANRNLNPRFALLCTVVLAVALFRILPHPWNLSPVAALALFGGAMFAHRGLALAVPLAAMLLSDLVLGFHATIWVVYLAFALTVGIGYLLRGHQRSAGWLAGASLSASGLFFVLTNFGVWALTPLYPKTLEGLTACYVAAIPFLQNTVVGDLLFTAVLFGGFALLERQFPALRASVAST